jgi:hypothetical protein
MDIIFLFLSDYCYYHQLNNHYPSTSKNVDCVTYKYIFDGCSMAYNHHEIIKHSSEKYMDINVYKDTMNRIYKHNDQFNSS